MSGSFDFSDLKRLKGILARTGANVDPAMRKLAKEVAARLYGGAIRNTKRFTKRRSGTLERSWDVSEIRQKGDVYGIDVFNHASDGGVKYAIYVEYGHRTRVRKDGTRGWVNGRFMLTKARSQVEGHLPKLVDNIALKMLKEEFNK